MIKTIASGSAFAALPVRGALGEQKEYETETIFGNPSLTGEPDENQGHEEAFKRILKSAVPSSEFHASLSHGIDDSRENLPEVIIDAADRGVDVNFVVDEHGEGTVGIQQLREEVPDSVHIVYDRGVGDYLNHNKFLICEELDNGDQNVVWQSLHKFTEAQ